MNPHHGKSKQKQTAATATTAVGDAMQNENGNKWTDNGRNVDMLYTVCLYTHTHVVWLWLTYLLLCERHDLESYRLDLMLCTDKRLHGHRHDSIDPKMVENKEFRFRLSVCVVCVRMEHSTRNRKIQIEKRENEKREELVERMSVWIECVLLISSINYCKNINQLGAAREVPGEHSANGIDEN